MNINKSPGPDGYGGGFFRAAWHIIGPEVRTTIEDLFLNGKLLEQLNNTIISLIPKT